MLIFAIGARYARLADKTPDSELRLVTFIRSGCVRLGLFRLLQIARKVSRQQLQFASHERTHSFSNAS